MLNTCRLAIAGLLLGAHTLFGQPTNDDFANRAILSGASLIFSGNLTNSTLEAGEPPLVYGSTGSSILYRSNSLDGSLWWTWTAPISSPVVISILRDYSTGQSQDAVLEVFSGTNFAQLQQIDYTPFQLPGIRYLKFSAVAGSDYQFRVSGHWFRDFSVQLTASTAPVIIQQPQSCTVSPYNSTYFYVIAAGLPTPTYQWLFNGAPLPGETAPILIVRNILTNAAGAYSVIVSNSGGAIQSTAAALAVTDTNPIPILTALPPTNASQVPFILKGEPGRSYVFDATDDFVHWNTCIYCFGWSGHAGDVSNSFTVPRINLQRQFIKAWLDTHLDTCVAQVHAMRAALALYNIENKLMPADWGYTVENLAPYLPGATIPSCPQDGIYWPGAAVSNIVTCSWSYRGHDLPWDLRSFQ